MEHKCKKTNDGPTHNHKSQILSNGYFQLQTVTSMLMKMV